MIFRASDVIPFSFMVPDTVISYDARLKMKANVSLIDRTC